ncbi:unnamed protein product [Discosporangium mesarthrocarpum]
MEHEEDGCGNLEREKDSAKLEELLALDKAKEDAHWQHLICNTFDIWTSAQLAVKHMLHYMLASLRAEDDLGPGPLWNEGDGQDGSPGTAQSHVSQNEVLIHATCNSMMHMLLHMSYWDKKCAFKFAEELCTAMREETLRHAELQQWELRQHHADSRSLKAVGEGRSQGRLLQTLVQLGCLLIKSLNKHHDTDVRAREQAWVEATPFSASKTPKVHVQKSRDHHQPSSGDRSEGVTAGEMGGAGCGDQVSEEGVGGEEHVPQSEEVNMANRRLVHGDSSGEEIDNGTQVRAQEQLQLLQHRDGIMFDAVNGTIEILAQMYYTCMSSACRLNLATANTMAGIMVKAYEAVEVGAIAAVNHPPYAAALFMCILDCAPSSLDQGVGNSGTRGKTADQMGNLLTLLGYLAPKAWTSMDDNRLQVQLAYLCGAASDVAASLAQVLLSTTSESSCKSVDTCDIDSLMDEEAGASPLGRGRGRTSLSLSQEELSSIFKARVEALDKLSRWLHVLFITRPELRESCKAICSDDVSHLISALQGQPNVAAKAAVRKCMERIGFA